MGYDAEVLRLMAIEADLAVAVVDAEDRHADHHVLTALRCQLAAVEDDVVRASLAC